MADDTPDPRSGEAVTVNYGWVKPNVGNSDDAWGGMLNADLDQIDAIVHGIDTRAIPGPSSSTPVMDGTATAGSATAWSRGDHAHPHDTSKYDTTNPAGYQTAAQVTASLAPYALVSSVPLASATAPVMDGTANAGTSAAFSRGDHVHPTDTTRYAATNPAGYITAAAIPAPYVLPTASTTVLGGVKVDGSTITATGGGVISATPAAPYVLPPASTTVLGGVKVDGTTIKAAGDGTISTTVVPLGDNRIINGNFAINQRSYVSGTALAAAAYGVDRWKAGASGCTYTFTATAPDTTITITVGTLTQVIEAGMIEGGVYTLSWTGTAQARVYQGTPTGSYAASPLATASLTAGTNTTVEFNTGTLTKVKLEIGSVATPFNRQSLAKSMADCQRYYQTIAVSYRTYLNAISSVASGLAWSPMRAAPTAAVVTAGSRSNVTGLALNPYQPNSGSITWATTTTGDTYDLNDLWSLSAEL